LTDFSWVFEFRWILVGIGCLLLVAIFWWGSRRRSQARGAAVDRSGAPAAPMAPRAAAPAAPMPPRAGPPAAPIVASRAGPPAAPSSDFDAHAEDWGVPPFEPLSIRTGDYDQVPVLDLPMRADVAIAPAQPTGPVPAAASAHAPSGVPPAPAERIAGPADDFRPVDAAAPVPVPAAPVAAAAVRAAAPPPGAAPSRFVAGDRFDRAKPRPVSASEPQKIVTLRVSARGAAHWSGRDLHAVLESQGLGFGRYGVYHRNDAEGRSLFCVASLVEPGSFDLERMPEQEFPGVTAFAVLPGSADPLQTFDALLLAVCGVAEALDGIVQDSKGTLLSAQRARELREDVVQFKANLP